MKVFRTTLFSVLFIGKYCFHLTSAAGNVAAVQLADACVEFKPDSLPSSAWTFADCIEVWKQFISTLPPGLQRYTPMVDIWRDTALELRRAASPCIMATAGNSDGVGSTTIRLMAAWIFSREMGCDWVTPDFGKRSVDGGNGTVMYCHGVSTLEEHQLFNASVTKKMNRCSAVNWIDYFQFRVPSVDEPDGKNVNIVELALHPVQSVARVKGELHDLDIANLPWGRVKFTFTLSFASRHLVCGGCWDQNRRQIVRTVLYEARRNFHRHPRPWYEESPECAYDNSRLNFAIHVRMGDRRTTETSNVGYFTSLEQLIETVTEVAVSKGLRPPLFHVFSETVMRCPSVKTGSFDEFPSWPVAPDQVTVCSAANKPEDCLKQGTVTTCSSIRSGLFNVREKPIVLHLGPDVKEALSCMIHSDGVVMGCSTFGQIAGLFTEGISFFSTRCEGNRTPYQYRMIPPLAIAERGHLWVPILGSWHDPILASTELFRGALDTLLATKDASTKFGDA